MQKVYRMIPILEDDENPFRIDDFEELSTERDYSELFSGVPLDDAFYCNFKLKASDILSPIDYVSNPLSWPVCSNRLVDLLKCHARGDFQCSDVTLIHESGKEISYQVVNLLRRLECFSKKRGEVRIDTSPSGSKYVWFFPPQHRPS